MAKLSRKLEVYRLAKFAYMILGTIKKKVWQAELKQPSSTMGATLKHTADFKKLYDLDYQPAGWYPANE